MGEAEAGAAQRGRGPHRLVMIPMMQKRYCQECIYRKQRIT